MEEKIKQQNCGIYKITNLINGKVYIGQSCQIQKRWSIHKWNAKNNENQAHLYLAMRKYGIENFSFEVIEYCSRDSLNDREIYWIQYYNSTNSKKGYNILYGGKCGGPRYDYNKIYLSWLDGKTCKEIEQEFNCGDNVITSALRMYGISEQEVRSRSITYKRQIVLKDIKTNLSLKVFEGAKSAARFFELPESKADNILNALCNGYRFYGFKWEDLNENNKPLKEYNKEEILAYKAKSQYTYTEEEKLKISLLNRTIERPSRDELKKLIRTKPFTQIAEIYGVSDNAIRKWCDFEKLPRKKKDINSYSDEEWEKI